MSADDGRPGTVFIRDQETRTGTVYLTFDSLDGGEVEVREVLFSNRPRHATIRFTLFGGEAVIPLDDGMARELRAALGRYLPADESPDV
jgi:hypothetical protein